MRKIVIVILWGLSCFHANGQSVNHAIDSLQRMLQSHRAVDSLRVDIMLALADAYIGISADEMLFYSQGALDLADSLHYERGMMTCHNALAHAYFVLAKYSESIDHAMTASLLAEKRNDLRQMGESYRYLGNIYSIIGDDQRTAYFYRKTIHAATAQQSKGLAARTYCSMGMWFYADGHVDSAQFYLKKSLALAEAGNVSFFKPYIIAQLGWTYHTSNPDKAIQYQKEALSLASEVQNIGALTGILNNLGKIYTKMNEYSTAEKYLMRALALAEENKFHNNKTFIYQGLIDLNIRRGRVEDVRKYVDAYIATRDSMINEEKMRQTLALQTRYETEKHEQAISMLEQEKRADARWMKLLIVAVIVSLILTAVIYRQQILSRRKDRALLDAQKILNQKLKDTDRMRSHFFASISHEFRTPISLILAPLEAKLKSTSITARDKNDLRLVMRNANRLGELVNQVLDLSKLEAGKMEVEPTYGSLASFITPLLASYESLAEQRKISFKHEMQIDQANHAFDHDKLEKIITNLVTNAFKFTREQGAIDVRVLSDRDTVVLRIADTGRGIPESDLPFIFTPFFQSGRSEDNDFPGTGLGLALVNELVKVLHGTIEVQSKVGEGTEIIVVIPLPDVASVAHDRLVRSLPVLQDEADFKEEAATETFSETLLIIEDNPELRRFIRDHFSGEFNLLTASNGKQALQIAFDQIPSLVVSDVMMPEMDGIEFMKAMKADSRTDHIPIALLSAQADQESKIAALQLGADEYMTKPFSLQELEVRVKSIISNRKKTAEYFRRMLISVDRSNRIATTESIPTDSVNSRFVKKLQQCISQNLNDPSFGVEELAGEMCLSRTQLFRKVKMVLDTTPSDLIGDMRLQQAASMILTKSDTLAQIAYAVGFREQSYFAKRFRKKFGVSPREYAERAQMER